jgi:CIC family chloride channel protein
MKNIYYKGSATGRTVAAARGLWTAELPGLAGKKQRRHAKAFMGRTPQISSQTNNLARPNRPVSHPLLWLLAVLVGLIAGMGAVLFRGLISLFHNTLFLKRFSLAYDANLHTPPSPWGAAIILVPVAGAVGVAFLVKNFALEAKGHGVPEVMEAIYYRKGIIRPVVAVIKSLASALSIGSGGSVGREGPIVQIGSAFGSTISQWLHLPAWQRITMIAAGAGGGIAATFNTPIGGVLFAAELLLHEVSVWTLVPVVISTATATYVGRLFLGANPSFVIPAFQAHYFHHTKPLVLAAYLALGGLLGLVSTFFIKSIYAFEDFFDEHIPGNYYTRHLLGMLAVGILLYLTMAFWGHYYIEGVGYSTVQDVLTGALSSLPLMLLLFLLKVVATALTLGSGGSGGIFSPSLFLGATFGGAYGVVLRHLFPALGISPPAFAVVGMAGVVGSATGAAITAIVMIFEMTLDYNVILPMTATVALSYGMRKFLCKDSIYTLKLTRRAHHMPEALQANFPMVRLARDLMDKRLAVVPASAAVKELAQTIAAPEVKHLLVEHRGSVTGVVRRDAALEFLVGNGANATIGALAEEKFQVVAETTVLFDIVSSMHADDISVFIVATSRSDPIPVREVKGIITKDRIADAVTETIGLSKE